MEAPRKQFRVRLVWEKSGTRNSYVDIIRVGSPVTVKCTVRKDHFTFKESPISIIKKQTNKTLRNTEQVSDRKSSTSRM